MLSILRVMDMAVRRHAGCALSPWLICIILLGAGNAWCADSGDDFDSFGELKPFKDAPLPEAITHPAWFKLSFLDLRDDLAEAIDSGKQGLLVYFGQKYCAYCKKLLEINFGKKQDIVDYTRKHFDVIGMDIHGQRTVTGMDGREWDEHSFALENHINFTPTLIFYDKERREALRLSGYYPPYQFQAALEYVADGFYKRESFRSYLARADVPMVFDSGDMNYEDFFAPGPQALDRSRIPAQRPLVVFFEQSDCHACDILHTGPLRDPDILQRVARFDASQLNMWKNTPVITPGGEHTTAKKWADELGLFYTPTLLFFDEHGKEILRVDSVVQFYRLRNVLDYVLSGAYHEYPSFQQWRTATRR
jgi:thioredoxin-related protein